MPCLIVSQITCEDPDHIFTESSTSVLHLGTSDAFLSKSMGLEMTIHTADETAQVCCGSLQIPSQYATDDIELWTGSKAKIVKVPEDIKSSSLFKLPLDLPMESHLSINPDPLKH